MERATVMKGLAVVSLIVCIIHPVSPWLVMGIADATKTKLDGIALLFIWGIMGMLLPIGNWLLYRTVKTFGWKPEWLMEFVLPILASIVIFLIPLGLLALFLFNIVVPIAVLVMPVRPKPLKIV